MQKNFLVHNYNSIEKSIQFHQSHQNVYFKKQKRTYTIHRISTKYGIQMIQILRNASKKLC